MLIGRILYPVQTLGPGNRIVIWTCGCSKECPNCISPEWWKPISGTYMDLSVDMLFATVKRICEKYKPDGITISGGDPFEQANELFQFLRLTHSLFSDTLVYTGFTLEELERILSCQQFEDMHRFISVLIDGRYVNDLNDNQSALIGSVNQKIHYFDSNSEDRYMRYTADLGRRIQFVESEDTAISIGIHNKGEGVDAE